jgi:hypothetical protein
MTCHSLMKTEPHLDAECQVEWKMKTAWRDRVEPWAIRYRNPNVHSCPGIGNTPATITAIRKAMSLPLP